MSDHFYINNPTIRMTDDTNKGRMLFRLEEDLVVEVWIGPGSLSITIPRGYITDFASTPRPLWFIFPPTGKYARAAIVHDYFYSYADKNDCTRFFADTIFRELMCQLKVPTWKRVLMYYGVRFGGFFLWKGKK